MNPTELSLLQQEITALRRGYRVQRVLLGTVLVAIAGLAVIALGSRSPVAAQSTAIATDADGILHVRGLVVEDASGHERVRLGARCRIR
jgi:hypothetical protein